MIGGVWFSKAERESGEPPAVILHHEPRVTRVGVDRWFDALITVLADAWERLITRVLGLFMVGVGDDSGLLLDMRPTIEHRFSRTALPIVIPDQFLTTVHATAPPNLRRPAVGRTVPT
jgi:hypothetical protein